MESSARWQKNAILPQTAIDVIYSLRSATNLKKVFNRKLKRKLINVERVLWKRGYISLNVIMVAKIKGSFSTEQLNDALLKVSRKYPLLRIKIKLEDNDDAFFVSEDVPEFSIRTVSSKKGDDWLQEAKEELLSTIPWEKGPLIRFVLVQSPDINDLIINCYHCICDGLSIAFLLRDLLFSLANPDEKVDLISETPIYDELLPSSVSGNSFTKLGIKREYSNFSVN